MLLKFPETLNICVIKRMHGRGARKDITSLIVKRRIIEVFIFLETSIIITSIELMCKGNRFKNCVLRIHKPLSNPIDTISNGNSRRENKSEAWNNICLLASAIFESNGASLLQP